MHLLKVFIIYLFRNLRHSKTFLHLFAAPTYMYTVLYLLFLRSILCLLVTQAWFPVPCTAVIITYCIVIAGHAKVHAMPDKPVKLYHYYFRWPCEGSRQYIYTHNVLYGFSLSCGCSCQYSCTD